MKRGPNGRRAVIPDGQERRTACLSQVYSSAGRRSYNSDGRVEIDRRQSIGDSNFTSNCLEDDYTSFPFGHFVKSFVGRNAAAPTVQRKTRTNQSAQEGLTLGNPSQATIGAQTGDEDPLLLGLSAPKATHQHVVRKTDSRIFSLVWNNKCQATSRFMFRDSCHERT